MTRLLVIADDFTGALDTGVQFASRGIRTRVLAAAEYAFGREKGQGAAVVIIDAETRHLNQEQAYEIVFRLVSSAAAAGIPYIYKKTDSALRGNVGSELAALYDAAGKGYLNFIPAWPKMGRIVRDGVLYIKEEPVSQSAFGQDPYEPVRYDEVSQILRQQTDLPIHNVDTAGNKSDPVYDAGKEGICIYDAVTEEELSQAAAKLRDTKRLHVIAGCAGFAAKLPEMLGLQGEAKSDVNFSEKLLVVCGSVNPVTKKQLDYAERSGMKRIRLTPEQKLEPAYWTSQAAAAQLALWAAEIERNKCCIMDTNDPDAPEAVPDSVQLERAYDTAHYAAQHSLGTEDVRIRISERVGSILKELLVRGIDRTLMVTGGDTLLGFMKQIGDLELHILCELATGCVLSEFTYRGKRYHIISKSGGFGEEDLLCRLKEMIDGGKKNDAASV